MSEDGTASTLSWTRWLYRAYQTWWHVRRWVAARMAWARLAIAALVLSGAVAAAAAFADSSADQFADADAFDALTAFLFTLGGALIGATAIASSLILFAMQVNVERMPHGLFRRLSRDPQLLATVGLSFLLAITVCAAGLIPNARYASAAVATAAVATVSILALQLAAYRRALDLINPVKQLHILTRDVRRHLNGAAGWATRLSPMMDVTALKPLEKTGIDAARLVFFRANASWDVLAQRGIAYAISYARRFAEAGDTEVSDAALAVVVTINRDYIRAKGRTFIRDNPFIENPLAREGLFTSTLEHLRQTAEGAIARRDEAHTSAIFRALSRLVSLYVAIDYGESVTRKSHATLAAAYLSGVVERSAAHMGTDVLMEAARQMGSACCTLISAGDPVDIVSTIDRLPMLALPGLLARDMRPASQAMVRVLADATTSLLWTSGKDIHFAVIRLRTTAMTIALQALAVKDEGPSSEASFVMEPYYGSATTGGLCIRVAELANVALARDADDEEAKQFIANIAVWADGLFQPQKDLLLKAAQMKSMFCHDIMTWNLGVADICMALAAAPSGEQSAATLRRSALFLASTLGWLPTDRESVGFLEGFSTTEQMFESALTAVGRNSDDVAERLQQQLLEWAVKAGASETGWGVLEKGLAGWAALIIERAKDNELASYVNKLALLLAGDPAPSMDEQARAADQLRARLADAPNAFAVSQIERVFAGQDPNIRTVVINAIAERLEMHEEPTNRGRRQPAL